jgi:hypothetical protein
MNITTITEANEILIREWVLQIADNRIDIEKVVAHALTKFENAQADDFNAYALRPHETCTGNKEVLVLA